MLRYDVPAHFDLHPLQEEMAHLSAQGIFVNNPINSSMLPGYIKLNQLTDTGAFQLMVTFFISDSGNNQNICEVYNYPAGCIKTDGSTTPFAKPLYAPTVFEDPANYVGKNPLYVS